MEALTPADKKSTLGPVSTDPDICEYGEKFIFWVAY